MEKRVVHEHRLSTPLMVILGIFKVNLKHLILYKYYSIIKQLCLNYFKNLYVVVRSNLCCGKI